MQRQCYFYTTRAQERVWEHGGDTRVIMMSPRTVSCLLICVVPIVIAGCFGGAPSWVERGSGAFQHDAEAFYVVGAVKGITSKALAERTADNRARAELGKILEAYSADVMRDYAASAAVDGFVPLPEEADEVEQEIEAFAAATLDGMQIVNHWTNKEEGITYALAKLDIEDFEARIAHVTGFSGEIREYLRTHADRLFDHRGAEEAESE